MRELRWALWIFGLPTTLEGARERAEYFAGGVVWATCIVLPALIDRARGRAAWIGRGVGR